jgi:hypothetical protein
MSFTDKQWNIIKACVGKDVRENTDWKSVYWGVRKERMNMFKLIKQKKATELIRNFELELCVILDRVTKGLSNGISY